jgi:hypothetical protein
MSASDAPNNADTFDREPHRLSGPQMRMIASGSADFSTMAGQKGWRPAGIRFKLAV